MVITFTTILIGLLVLIRPLQKNSFYIMHAGFVILAAYYIENTYFKASLFSTKTMLLFLVFHAISINITTFIAYFVDKRAAMRHSWRVSENTLHVMEFLGGWPGAYLAQKIFHHKTNKKNFQNIFLLMIFLEFLAILIILKYVGLI